MEFGWLGLPYHTIAEHYNQLFGEKIYKIPVAVVDNCPNRMGLKGMQTCVFCDVWGSAADSESMMLPLREQIETTSIKIGKKYKAKSFLVYFQAYTNTFTKVSSLRQNFDTALSYPFVKGFVLGTRPDCLSPMVLDLWQEYQSKSSVLVELGVQSFFDDDLEFMKRGHSAEDSLKAIQKISTTTSVDLGIHLIFGNPGESLERIKQTALICNDLPITNVKLHNLHVLKNTPLEKMFFENKFTPVEFLEYAEKVEVFLQHLDPRIAVQRLAAYAPRWDELVAPDWTRDKMRTHQELIDYLRERGSYQGQQFSGVSESSVLWQQKMLERSAPSEKI